MKKRIILLLTFIYVSVAISIGQQNINCVVISAEDNQSLPVVTVLAKGTSTGVITNVDGSYAIEVPDGTTALVFSFIGLKSQEVVINGQTKIDIALELEVTGLDEVIVIGYGTQIKTNLTESISSVSNEDMQGVPNVTFESSLQGRTSCVLMTIITGKLGKAFNVRVRGTNSITLSNQPLSMIDGMIIEVEDFGINTNQPLNPLFTLDTNAIESVQVLKDASASAIYRSRGLNGVVIVSTKSGKKGEKSKINFGYSLSTHQPTNRIEMLNLEQYIELFSEAAENA